MRKWKRSYAWMRKVALVLALVITLPFVPGGEQSRDAVAMNSLPHITQIAEKLQKDGSFTILEVVPENGTGSFGYYVSGSEPGAGWRSSIAGMDSTAERKAFVDEYFQNLVDRGLLGSGDTTPLKLLYPSRPYYEEIFPWGNAVYNGWELPAEEGWEVLNLANEARREVTQAGAVPADGDGDLLAYYDYFLDLADGTHVQDILHYLYIGPVADDLEEEGGPADEEDTEEEAPAHHSDYTYNPEFKPVDSTIPLVEGLAVYTKVSVEVPNPAYEAPEDDEEDSGEEESTGGEEETEEEDDEETPEPEFITLEYYLYDGTVGTTGYYLQGGVEYYYVTSGGVPYSVAEEDESSEKGLYIPVLSGKGDGFREADTGAGEAGHFVNEPTGEYRYRPGGDGDYRMTGDSDPGKTITVVYNTVLIRGGYENNHWFLRHVLNLNENDLKSRDYNDVSLTVRSTRADNVYASQVENADMIVLSAGFPADGSPAAAYGALVQGSDSRIVDLSPAIAELVYQRASLSYQIPVFVDFRIASGTEDTYMRKLARFFATVDSKNGYATTADMENGVRTLDDEHPEEPAKTVQNRVNRNFYIYTPTAGGGEPGFRAAATSSFCKVFTTTEAIAGFQAVLDDIRYENFLLEVENAPAEDYLDETVSIANAIRYIINFGEGRNRSTKKSFRVLELQGGTGKVLGNGNTGKDIILSWLPADCGILRSDIEVVTMSTAEFVGKIEDLSETYDLIYIGSSRTGLASSYNDNAMGEMVYYNIGDILNINSNLTGMLNSDYPNGNRNSNVSVATPQARLPGNDITPAKAQALRDFAASGYPIVLESDLLTTTLETDSKSYTVTITYSDGKLTATVLGDESENLTADASYTWYYLYGSDGPKELGSDSRSLDISSNNNSRTYYCEVSYTKNGWTVDTKAYSNRIAAKGKTYISNDDTLKQPGRSIKTTTVAPADSAINGKKIDNCSRLYETLTAIKEKKNVMSTNGARNDPVLLLSYMNLSKPIIEFASEDDKPIAYKKSGSDMTTLQAENGRYYLEYTFTIRNYTDASPDKTTYDVILYYDQNGDGRYTEDDALGDIAVRHAGTNALQLPSGGAYRLKADTAYTVKRELNARGIVSWKLSIVKNGAAHIHSSETGFTRIAPESQDEIVPVNVLQLLPTSSYGGITVDLETDAVYGRMLAEIEDFDIHFTVAYCDGSLKNGKRLWPSGASADEIYRVLVGEEEKKEEDEEDEEDEEETIIGYDMLVIGFADCYDGIDENTAGAIIKYIEDERAVLFTHDTTSLQNIKKGNSDPAYTELAWGYYFNTILRDTASMDVYGISSLKSPEGLSGTTTIASLLQAGGLSGSLMGTANAAKKANAELLESAGYSVAYQPGSNKQMALPLTQGYSAYALHRWPSSGGSNPATTKVSQINMGQITTYPFNINTNAFDSSNSFTELSVASTHGQYYQLNLNSEDIVVWYALSKGDGDYYSTKPNDAASNYYIFNKGNITYSGVGHSGGVTEHEAMLFLNTMIAAYRIVSRPPAIMLTDENGAKIDYLYFMTDTLQTVVTEENEHGEEESKTIEGVGLVDPDDRTVNFTFYDANIDSAKELLVEFWYQCVSYDKDFARDMGATELPFTFGRRADGTLALGEIIPLPGVDESLLDENGRLTPNVTYGYELPQSLMDDLIRYDELILYVQVTDESIDPADMTEEEIENSIASVTLRKLLLQNLN